MNKSPALLTIIFIVIFAILCTFMILNPNDHYVQLIPQQSAPSGKLSNPININTATIDELVLLPGIGENTANKILSYRQENGPFDSISDLSNVTGIGPETLREISNYITVGE